MIRRALGEPGIRAYLIGTFTSNVGTWIQRIAVGWLVFDLTHSAAWVGAVVACEVLPALAIGPFAGLLADRANRVQIFAVGQFFAIGQATTLAALAWSDLLVLPVFVITSLALGIIDGFNQPTRLTLVSDIATAELLPATIAMNSIGFNAARFIGPAIGGAMLTLGGAPLAFAANALSFVPLVAFLFMYRSRIPHTGGLADSARDGLLGGVRHVVCHAVLAPIFLMILCSSILGRSLIELLPAVSGIWFSGSPQTLASLTAAVGIGAIAGAAWMSQRSSIANLLAAAVTFPGCLTALVILLGSTNGILWLAYPILVFAGFFAIGYGVGLQTIVQLTVGPQYRGRVVSMYSVIQRGFPAVGAFLIGMGTDMFGLQIALITGGCLGLLLWYFIWRRRAIILAALNTMDIVGRS